MSSTLKHGERDLLDTVFLVIFPLGSLMKDHVSIVHEKEIKDVLGPETSDTGNKEASKGKYYLECPGVPWRYLVVTEEQN